MNDYDYDYDVELMMKIKTNYGRNKKRERTKLKKKLRPVSVRLFRTLFALVVHIVDPTSFLCVILFCFFFFFDSRRRRLRLRLRGLHCADSLVLLVFFSCIEKEMHIVTFKPKSKWQTENKNSKRLKRLHRASSQTQKY